MVKEEETKQEKKNHKAFFINFMIFITGTLMMANGGFYIWTLGWILILLSWLTMGFIGYSQGWELKRISSK